jgi:hypothetical protein
MKYTCNVLCKYTLLYNAHLHHYVLRHRS